MNTLVACPGCVGTPSDAITASSHRGLMLSVPDLRCAGCISTVERTLSALPGVTGARVNLTRKQVQINGVIDPDDAVFALKSAGYAARELDPELIGASDADPIGRDLLMCLAVAGFAMMNVMLLSVAVWSGAADATRTLFHWVSASIAIPAVAFSARPFFVSAWSALSARRLNMDVPIAVAIAIACAMSVYETAYGGHHAWFDAALALTFFLLIGRYLDHLTRKAARSAAAELTALENTRVTRVSEHGRDLVRPAELRVGDCIQLVAGDQMSVDAWLREGRALVDRSLITGESDPVSVSPGDPLTAGETILDGQLIAEVSTVGEDTTLRQFAALVELAESAKNRYTALADRAARIYAPAVHLLALFAFVGWIVATGDARLSLNIAVAVLIITCPCALGLAVPAVSTTAAGRLFRDGFLVRHSTALERLGEIDTVVFDKTGTLTTSAEISGLDDLDAMERGVLSGLARASAHPVSQAIAVALKGEPNLKIDNVREYAGKGISGEINGQKVLLGSPDWVGGGVTGTAFRIGDGKTHSIERQELLRTGAISAVDEFRDLGFAVHMISGDHEAAVNKVATDIRIKEVAANLRPEEKISYLQRLEREGGCVLMVGDGLNDTGALATAHASIAPASALNASRAASDIVLLHESLERLPAAVRVARSARRRVRENFAIAATYNLIAVPLALAGFATPLIAALAMSTSSITVVLNSLRVRWS
ncbi:MAG: heavy metal translocating P-type ATPase [Boseongicola sp.]